MGLLAEPKKTITFGLKFLKQMSTTLILNIESEVIEQAEQYADEHSTSLRRLVEEYLIALTTPHPQQMTPGKSLKDLKGKIQFIEGYDYKSLRNA